MEYIYEPLLENVSQVRLIRLVPRSLPQPTAREPNVQTMASTTTRSTDVIIACSMFKVNVEELSHQPFNALSYTWGEPTPSRGILVDGRSFRIRQNLWEFLEIASTDPELYSLPLWIDQICIDQSSNAEKSQQVQDMHNLFLKAARVFMWLGQLDDAASSMMEALNRGRFSDFIGDTSDSCPPGSMARKRRDLLVSFMNREYWRRLWIIQEVLIGPASQKLMICGKYKVAWEHLVQFTMDLNERETERNAWGLMIGTDAAPIIEWTFYRAEHQGQSLADLVMAFSTRECMEERDKVYALLGLTDAHYRIPVDYNIPLLQLCKEVLEQRLQQIEAARQEIGTGRTYIIYERIMGHSLTVESEVFCDIIRGEVEVYRLLRSVANNAELLASAQREERFDNEGCFDYTAREPEWACANAKKLVYYIYKQIPRHSEQLKAWLDRTELEAWEGSDRKPRDGSYKRILVGSVMRRDRYGWMYVQASRRLLM